MRLFLVPLLFVFIAAARPAPEALEADIARIDELAADPEIRLPLIHAMAQELGTHRNRLILLKKQSGQSFGRIFAAELRARGLEEQAVLAKLRELGRSFQDGAPPVEGTETESPLRPILFVSATTDHNSAGTYLTLTPEAGIDTRRAAFVVGVPVYRIWASQLNATGVGDAYAAAFLRHRAGRCELGSSLTLGFPTGDRERGLGAGKVTADLNGTVYRRFERLRPFFTAGVTNSVFDNVGYQRPFISNGNAWYLTGGFDAQPLRRITIGAGGFALHAMGTHTVISRMNQMASASHGGSASSGGHGMQGMGQEMPGRPPGLPEPPFYGHPGETAVAGDELSDHGASAWVVIALHRDVSLNLTVARSLPFELTTLRVGLGFNLAAIFTPATRAR